MRLTASDFALGALTAAWYATPDFIESRGRRAAVKAGVLLVGGYAAYRLEPATTEDEEQEPEPVPEPEDADRASAILAGLGLTAAALGSLGSLAIERRIPGFAEKLRDRGVRRPNTAIGAVFGGLVVASGPLMRAAEERLDAS